MDAVGKYKQAAKKIVECEGEHQSLVKKLDTMETETKSLREKVEFAEIEERKAYDAFFLKKASEKDLAKAQDGVRKVKEGLTTHSKMIESLNRCIKTKESEIGTLHKEKNSLRHKVWGEIFRQKESELPESLKEQIKKHVKELIVIGVQFCDRRDSILDRLFPSPEHDERQAIYKSYCQKYDIE